MCGNLFLIGFIRCWFVSFAVIDSFVSPAVGTELGLNIFYQPKEYAFLFSSCITANGAVEAFPGHTFIFFSNHLIRSLSCFAAGGAAGVLCKSAIGRKQE